jgi:hypothetical protein
VREGGRGTIARIVPHRLRLQHEERGEGGRGVRKERENKREREGGGGRKKRRRVAKFEFLRFFFVNHGSLSQGERERVMLSFDNAKVIYGMHCCEGCDGYGPRGSERMKVERWQNTNTAMRIHDDAHSTQ